MRHILLTASILFFSAWAISVILDHADEIDGIEEIPQYDAVWRGVVNDADTVTNSVEDWYTIKPSYVTPEVFQAIMDSIGPENITYMYASVIDTVETKWVNHQELFNDVEEPNMNGDLLEWDSCGVTITSYVLSFTQDTGYTPLSQRHWLPSEYDRFNLTDSFSFGGINTSATEVYYMIVRKNEIVISYTTTVQNKD